MQKNLNESAHFYAEDLAIPLWVASNVADFLDFSIFQDSILNPNVWQNDDRSITRVYFKQWSQNRFPPLKLFYGQYYCPYDAEIYYIDSFSQGKTAPLSTIAKLRKEWYSGAQTRKKIESLAESFYGKNIYKR